jgi:hypothetical protein
MKGFSRQSINQRPLSLMQLTEEFLRNTCGVQKACEISSGYQSDFLQDQDRKSQGSNTTVNEEANEANLLTRI